MKLYNEISDLSEFEPWSGAVETCERIINSGKGELFISMLDDIYPDGLKTVELNDLLWFDPEFCFELVGIEEESEEN